MRAARKAARIIETGSVQLGREIEMLSPSPPYHHQDHCAKAIKEPKRISGVMQNPREQNASQQGALCTSRARAQTHVQPVKKKRRTRLTDCTYLRSFCRKCFSLQFEITLWANELFIKVRLICCWSLLFFSYNKDMLCLNAKKYHILSTISWLIITYTAHNVTYFTCFISANYYK